MIGNRKKLSIHCHSCPVSSLCVPHNLNPVENEIFNTIVKQIYFLEVGEHLYFKDEKMKNIYAVYSGCCKEYLLDPDGEEKINGFYLPGDLLALESLSDQQYAFSVSALEPSQFCVIPIDSLFSLMNESLALLQRFICLMSNKLQRNNVIPITTNAKRRIASFLLDIFYRNHNKSSTQDAHIHLSMSQSDIGNLLGLAHETVSRTLHSFEDEKIVTIFNKNIYLINIVSLKEIS